MKHSRLMILRITDPEEKMHIARYVLDSLTEWFGITEAREAYISSSAEEEMFAAFISDQPIGFLCLKETGKDTMEISVMGILREYHHIGIGTELFSFAKQAAAEEGCSFLQVKTVQMGRYEEYDRTNLFYRSLGFREFEVIPDLWDEANPCQIYVMHIEKED